MLGAVPETVNCQRVTCTEVVVAVSKIVLPTGVSDKLDKYSATLYDVAIPFSSTSTHLFTIIWAGTEDAEN